jgi:hypothetical protein
LCYVTESHFGLQLSLIQGKAYQLYITISDDKYQRYTNISISWKHVLFSVLFIKVHCMILIQIIFCHHCCEIFIDYWSTKIYQWYIHIVSINDSSILDKSKNQNINISNKTLSAANITQANKGLLSWFQLCMGLN